MPKELVEASKEELEAIMRARACCCWYKSRFCCRLLPRGALPEEDGSGVESDLFKATLSREPDVPGGTSRNKTMEGAACCCIMYCGGWLLSPRYPLSCASPEASTTSSGVSDNGVMATVAGVVKRLPEDCGGGVCQGCDGNVGLMLSLLLLLPLLLVGEGVVESS